MTTPERGEGGRFKPRAGIPPTTPTTPQQETSPEAESALSPPDAASGATPEATPQGTAMQGEVNQTPPTNGPGSRTGDAALDPSAPLGRKPDGTPKRGRGRPRKEWNRNPDPPGEIPSAPLHSRVLASPDNDRRYKAMAKMAVQTSNGALISLLGDEWRFKDGEETLLTDATYEYFKAIQMPDLPPGWVLVAVVCGYALPRVMSPTFKERVTLLMGGGNAQK